METAFTVWHICNGAEESGHFEMVQLPDGHESAVSSDASGDRITRDAEGQVIHSNKGGSGARSQLVRLSAGACVYRVDPVLLEDVEGTVDDCTQLSYLNVANLLENVRRRYRQAGQQAALCHQIYTAVGGVLLAVNPFSSLNQHSHCPASEGSKGQDNKSKPALYSEAMMRTYYGRGLAGLLRDPHPFAVAEASYKQLKAERTSQSIIISGESGSGKTETAKHVLRYLTSAATHAGDVPPAAKGFDLASRLLQSNPILEAFGNAHTVVYVPSRERNYHIFYSLCEAATDPNRPSKPLLMDPLLPPIRQAESYAYLQSKDPPAGLPLFRLENIQAAFEAFRVDRSTQQSIWRTLAAVMALGNVSFNEDGGDEATSTVGPKGKEALLEAAHLLGLDGAADEGHGSRGYALLEQVLTTRGVRETRSTLSKKAAEWARDDLAKTVYVRLFAYIVGLINCSLNADIASKDATSDGNDENDTASLFIGVLDIFGFENLNPHLCNGFEQLCINYLNELLHQHFLHATISTEQQLYKSEGLPFQPSAPFRDNADLIQCLGGTQETPGRFHLLDEATRSPVNKGASRDALFCSAVSSSLGSRFSHRIRVSPPPRATRDASQARSAHPLSVFHFAGKVTYDADGFTEQNNDNLPPELEHLLAECKGIVGCAPQDGAAATASNEKGRGGAGGRHKSAGLNFVGQVDRLLKTLGATTPHFIRCVKPNVKQLAFVFDRSKVYEQLEESGLVSVLEVMARGFPCRLPYATLHSRYQHLLHPAMQSRIAPRDFADLITAFLNIPKGDCTLGLTQAFFRLGSLQLVEQIQHTADDKFRRRLAEETFVLWLRKRRKRVLGGVRAAVRFLIGAKKRRALAVAQACHHHLKHVVLPRRRHK
ncbi:unnamed protein product [Vitrella brassicaformis CCMP3155]|uniref:Myosin motor domain-containing protein n=1 Tax=Vitrella brassicaformis (strain CCMP3155) TaxID=1169540 RepID=A0A0G4EF64_VITBC|nr:unnamed protein product [Vitrella brassicaformis CCMP3155]|eukprot:CEL94031.1 unnamed protein product [Vitrella brassicaformis CCMP3155]